MIFCCLRHDRVKAATELLIGSLQVACACSPWGIRYAFVLPLPCLDHFTDVFPLKNGARANNKRTTSEQQNGRLFK